MNGLCQNTNHITGFYTTDRNDRNMLLVFTNSTLRKFYKVDTVLHKSVINVNVINTLV